MNSGQTGAKRPELYELPQIRERFSFLYIERCMVNRQDSAVTFTDSRGTVYAPAAAFNVIMLGPGTNVSHRAMELLGDAGVTVIWVGEHGVRYYACGKPLTHSSRLLVAQAELVSIKKYRLMVARKMYGLRFPNEDVSTMTMQQLRGREGARIRKVYREASRKNNIPWDGRKYDTNNFDSGDDVNKALSAAHACLYGIVHSVIAALGCSPGLGFIHTGHERSFVYDIADLYKAEITIPIAFAVAASHSLDLASDTRRAVRDALVGGKVIKRIVQDIQSLLLPADNTFEVTYANSLALWDEKNGYVKNAVSYAREWDELNSAIHADSGERDEAW